MVGERENGRLCVWASLRENREHMENTNTTQEAVSQKRKSFLADVEHEVKMLRRHATPEEKALLDFDEFDPNVPYRCIYGQMTGSCASPRAKELMDLSCIRVMDIDEDRVGKHGMEDIDMETFNVNGEYTGQTWKRSGYRSRAYEHISALEGYIFTKGADVKSLMEYLKGESDVLTLN